jgi:hypothetical protein
MPLVTDEGVRGLIPWSYDGLIAAWEFLLRLERTPKDDWNLRPRSIKIVGDDGTVEEHEVNQARLVNQLMGFLRETYSPESGAAHFWRFQEIVWFLMRWEKPLRAKGLIDDAKVSGELLGVLAEAPFTTTREYGHDHCWTFSLDDVLARVAEDSGRRAG